MDLTGKHRAFADAVLAGKSNKDAAIAAGYSERTAGPAGSRLAKRKDIAAFIAKYRKADAGAPPPPPPPAGPKFDVAAAITFSDPMVFLKAAMNDPAAAPKLRVEAAKALLPFMHHKVGESGKKEQKLDAAKKVQQGRFGAPPPPPRLVSGSNK